MRIQKLVILVSVLILMGCSREPEREPYTPVSVNLTPVQLQAYQEFALALIRETSEAHPEENLFFSPLGVQITLAMIANGIEEKAYQELARVLGMPNATRETLNRFHSQLYALLKRPSEFVSADSVNALFYNQEGVLKETFADTLTQYYDAALQTFDGHNPQASVEKMNDWVKRHTNGAIHALIDESGFDQSSYPPVAFFLNSFVLDAEWQEYFDEAGERLFNTEKGEPRSVAMLHQPQVSAYADGTAIAVRVPLKGQEVSYYIVTSRREGDLMRIDSTPFEKPVTLQELVRQLTPQRWEQWRAHLKGFGQTELFMPRFHLTTRTEFAEPLQKMGLGRMFTQTDFSRMFKKPPLMALVRFVSYARQGASLEISARHVRVQGATGAEMASAESVPEVLSIDRPFVFLIVHEPTGVILYAGVLRYPPD